MAEALKYYDLTNYSSTFYSSNIALETYFTNLLFPNDSNRIVYASTAHAFRRRSIQQTQNPDTPVYLDNLNFPFMNYRGVIQDKTTRPWWNHVVNVQGVFIDELGMKVRWTPVTFVYDSTVYYHRQDEKDYGFYKVTWENSNETQIRYTVGVNGTDLPMMGVLTYKLQDEPQYNENDWLKKNHIHTITLGFEFQTQLILPVAPGTKFSITEMATLDFITLHPDAPIMSIDSEYKSSTEQYIIDYFNEDI